MALKLYSESEYIVQLDEMESQALSFLPYPI